MLSAFFSNPYLDLLKVQELDDYLRGVRGNNNTEQGIAKLPPEQKIDQGMEAILAILNTVIGCEFKKEEIINTLAKKRV